LKTISLLSSKGGTGKSTLSIILLNALSKMGYKCLGIDTDMVNHSLSFFYNKGVPFKDIFAKNIFHVMCGGRVEDNVLRINDNLDLLHGDVRIGNFRNMDTFKMLKKILDGVNYDYVVIDCAPTFDNVTANVLTASDTLIIPVVADVFNYQAVKFLFSKLVDLDMAELDINIFINQYEKPRTENKDTYSNQIIDLFTADEQINRFINSTYISRSSVIRKYLIGSGSIINNRKETAKPFRELGTLIKTVTGLTTEEI